MYKRKANLDLEGAGACSNCGLVCLPEVRFGALRDVLLPPSERIPETPSQSVHPLWRTPFLPLRTDDKAGIIK